MRIESISAIAFGPFVNANLEFAPGLNVVYGLNESGKSSWHSAIYAALCGIRRARGMTRGEDQQFKQLHHPWSGDSWRVSARIALEDGRKIELTQDLAGLIDCRATDVDLGRDVSSEIIFEGTPDISRWLGLDRRAFLATACVREAELLQVLNSAETLQEYLQRAADTAGTDETAAKALQLLEDFQREHVGQDRVYARRPLRTAIVRVENAETELHSRRDEHLALLEIGRQSQAATTKALSLEHRLLVLEAAVATRKAEGSERRLARAQELAARYPKGAPTSGTDPQSQHEVSAALAEWEARSDPTLRDGPTAAEIKRQISDLPTMPEGDLTPQQELLEAYELYRDKARRLELHEQSRPTPPPASPQPALTSSQLRDLAHELTVPEPSSPPNLENDAGQARMKQNRCKKLAWLLLGSSVATGIVSALLIIQSHIVLAAVLGSIAAATFLFALYLRIFYVDNLELRAKEAELARDLAQRAQTEWTLRTSQARSRAEVLGLAPNPDILRDAADEIDRAISSGRAISAWEEKRAHLTSELELVKARVSDALAGKGIDLSESLEGAVHEYVEACTERRELASRASRRSDLQEQLRIREQLEKTSNEATERNDRAASRLRDVASSCQIADGADEASLVIRLRAWLEGQERLAKAYQSACTEWAELKQLLDGSTLEDLQNENERRRVAASARAAEVEQSKLDSIAESDCEEQLELTREESRRAQLEAENIKGRLSAKEQQLPSVVEAEEELELAKAELRRVQILSRTLELTRNFLMRAQERIHRSIAPKLKAIVRQWLPVVTEGRYTDVAVDPENLSVRVRDPSGQWRNATDLSYGTKEQVFLFLRVAMATALTRSGEKCPLLLDEVTVQSDSVRTQAILAALQSISHERQVILFSQEDIVLEWARRNFKANADHLQILNGP